jgi:D-3-phosphoglycerate dehydrogenase
MTRRYRVLVSCPQAQGTIAGMTEELAGHGIEVWIPEIRGQQLGAQELISMLDDFDGIIAGDDELTAEVLRSAPRLKVISKWGVGIDGIDLDTAGELGIKVFNTPGAFGDDVADYALGFLILLARRQHIADAGVRAGQWPKHRGRSLAGMNLGIVGLGRSGRAFSIRALAIGMNVIGYDPYNSDTDPPGLDRVDLPVLLARSDVISLHVPANSETRRLIDASAIELMRDGVWLINVSRGSVVDQGALIDAIESGKIAAAALDVYEQEPLPTGSRLLSLPNVVLGSHNASNTDEGVLRATEAAVANLIEGLGV